MTVVEFGRRVKRLRSVERRKRSRLANRIADKLQVLVLTNPIAAREVEKVIDRLLRAT